MANVQIWRIYFCLTFIATLIRPAYLLQKKDNCEYDMDLTRNVIKITCDGSASSVNVYAETAHVSSEDDEIETDSSKGSDKDDDDDDDDTNGPKSGASKNGKNNRHDDTLAGRRRSNKELRPDNSQKPGRMSADRESHQKWDFSKFESSFSDVVWNATQKLDDARRKLTNYAVSFRNTSEQLSEGDNHLRSDMEKLRRTSNTASDLKEGIIAAMRNQYNYMRSALLTHNYELERILNSLDVLVNVTSDGFHSALMAHKTSLEQIYQLNTTLNSVKKMVSMELRKRFRRMRGLKKGNNSRECPKEISAIGSGQSRKIDSQNGAYMVESYTPNIVSSVWIMKGSGKSDQLIEYDTDKDIDYQLAHRYYALPFFCQGTGHAIYRRHFFCHASDTNTVIKYHLKKMDIVAEVVLPGKAWSRFPYKANANTDVDLAVDEMGLWAIYATEESGGKLVIAKINPKKMEVEKTWVTQYLKTEVGNTFMICGIMYATNSHSDTPTYIRYTYNTATSLDRVLEPGQLPFSNSASLMAAKNSHRMKNLANSVMLNYDFRSGILYSWSNSKVEMFPVYFHKHVMK